MDTLDRLVQFFASLPNYAKTLVVIWAIFTAAVVMMVLLAKAASPALVASAATVPNNATALATDTASPKTPSAQKGLDCTNSSLKSIQIDSGGVKSTVLDCIVFDAGVPRPQLSTVTAVEYFNKLSQLRDRFHERDQFIAEHRSARVTWRGAVQSVRKSAIGIMIVLRTKDATSEFFVDLPTNTEAKAYALRRSDVVVVTGILDLSTPSMPSIKADTFTRIDA